MCITPSFLSLQLQLSRDRQWGKKDHSLAGDEINKIIDMVVAATLMWVYCEVEYISGFAETSASY